MLEEIKFLKELQNELNTQDHDIQAAPCFWALMDYRWSPTWEENAERYSIRYDDEGCYSLEEIVEAINNNEFDLSDEQKKAFQEIDTDYVDDVLDWVKEHIYEDAYSIPERKESFIVPNTMFLTKAEAKRHIELNHYHYTSEVHTYAMTSWRAPKIEKLLKILETFDWDKVNQLQIENKKLRDTQNKLIQLLQKADEYSDKLEWKLFWETKDKIVKEVMKKNRDKN
nr:hypothetical protein [Heyndrickxia camelliae]